MSRCMRWKLLYGPLECTTFFTTWNQYTHVRVLRTQPSFCMQVYYTFHILLYQLEQVHARRCERVQYSVLRSPPYAQHVCMHVFMYVCMNACMHACTYTRTHAHAHAHACTHTHSRARAHILRTLKHNNPPWCPPARPPPASSQQTHSLPRPDLLKKTPSAYACVCFENESL